MHSVLGHAHATLGRNQINSVADPVAGHIEAMLGSHMVGEAVHPLRDGHESIILHFRKNGLIHADWAPFRKRKRGRGVVVRGDVRHQWFQAQFDLHARRSVRRHRAQKWGGVCAAKKLSSRTVAAFFEIAI